MGWINSPLLEDDYLHRCYTLEDANDRRLLDAQVILGACSNENPSIILEIGTSVGHTTSQMALTAPNAKIYTVNVPPEELQEAGTLTTFAPSQG